MGEKSWQAPGGESNAVTVRAGAHRRQRHATKCRLAARNAFNEKSIEI
jgi:hypothetical protein